MRSKINLAEGAVNAPSATSAEVEVWKDIPGYEGRYQASSFGRIRSLERTVAFGKQRRIVREHVLKQRKHSNSEHRTVGFWDSKLNRSTTQMVHQLVLRAFMGLPPNGYEVLHVNGDPIDNRLCNLRYGSHAENGIDRYQHAHAGLLLNQEQVRGIKKLLGEGLPQTEIAEDTVVLRPTSHASREGSCSNGLYKNNVLRYRDFLKSGFEKSRYL